MGDYLGPYLDALELDAQNLGKHMTGEHIKNHLKAHLLGSIDIDAWLDEIMNHMNNALGDAIDQARSNKYLTA